MSGDMERAEDGQKSCPLNLVRKSGGPLESKEGIENNEEGRVHFTSHSLTHPQTYTSHTLFLVPLVDSGCIKPDVPPERSEFQKMLSAQSLFTNHQHRIYEFKIKFFP